MIEQNVAPFSEDKHPRDRGDRKDRHEGTKPGQRSMLEVPLGVMQTIDVVNTTNIEHPLHIHGHFFQVALRNGKEAAEPGLKDTVWVGPEDTVRLVMPFDNPGMWMYHCHILEHEDRGMMGQFVVV